MGKIIEKSKWQQQIEQIRKDAVKRSRAVLTGTFSEQLAPYMPDFKYSPTEVRFVGKPIDFIVFKGLDNKEPEEVVFVEVKSGNSQLSTPERKLRDTIKEGKVSWELYRLPDMR
ncbi:hypothetical protein KY320_03175 [Candidatus Woesearchaeota archaeon]|nr:hypothetical protein [Candidatus Woesearchaeota archaeon]